MTAVPLNPGVDGADPPCGPHLDAEALARVLPFYLHLDADQRVLGCGPALAKACAAAVPGVALSEVFDLELPLDVQAQRVHLTARQRVPLVLRGEALLQADGTRLLILRADLHHTQEMAALGLGLDDLPHHDATAELMLVRRSGQLAQAGLQEALDQARHQFDDYAAMLQLAAGGVLYFDPQGLLRHCNAALENILELPGDELTGLSLARMDEVLQSNMVGIEPLPRVLEQLAQEVLRPVPHRYENLLPQGWRPAEMPTRTVQLMLPDRKFVRIGARAGRDGAVIFCFTDITRETEIDRMKSDFLATAAHELRSPMVSVIGFTELLLTRPYAPEKQRDMLGTVHRQANVLVGLVNELLDLSRIEARRGQDFEVKRCRLLPVIEQAAATLLIPNEQRKVRLVFESEAGGDAAHRWAQAEVCVDPEKLGLALSNVLSNAFKYSPQGGDVQIWVRGADLEGRPAVAIDVVDQGIGMTREQMARLFERFWRADPNGPIPGTGLGLCLVKEIVELQEGRVDVDSLPGRGTRVSLTLPLPQDGADGPALDGGAEPRPVLAPV